MYWVDSGTTNQSQLKATLSPFIVYIQIVCNILSIRDGIFLGILAPRVTLFDVLTLFSKESFSMRHLLLTLLQIGRTTSPQYVQHSAHKPILMILRSTFHRALLLQDLTVVNNTRHIVILFLKSFCWEWFSVFIFSAIVAVMAQSRPHCPWPNIPEGF